MEQIYTGNIPQAEDTFAMLDRLRATILRQQERIAELETENAELRVHLLAIAVSAERLARWIPALKELLPEEVKK